MTQIILGPPGTGKTTRLISLVEDALARGVSPRRIGYFSFTVKAATEARERAMKKFGLSKDELPNFSTLHSMCYRQLGLRKEDVLSGTSMKDFQKYAGVQISGRISEDGTSMGFSVGDRALFMENLSRIMEIPLEKLYDMNDDGLSRRFVLGFAEKLREFKKAHGLRDFTDMLTEFVNSGIRLGLKELYVDESQDLSKLQWRVVRKISDGTERFAVAGDDDQAIYRWAGADVDHLIDMDGDVQVLGQSYRVPLNVQSVANRIIGPIKHRREKTWAARPADGEVQGFRSFESVDCSTGQILVLARNNYVIEDQIIPSLRWQGILYRRLPYENWSISQNMLHAITAWENLRKGRLATVAEVKQIYKLMTSGRGVARGYKNVPGYEDDLCVDVKWMRENAGLLVDTPWFEALDMIPHENVSYIRKARARGEDLRKTPRVTVSTIHGSKGGEADHVVLLTEMAGRTYEEMHKNPDDERRVWYVAATRARERLTLVEPQRSRSCPWL